jgi:hypothetical protein
MAKVHGLYSGTLRGTAFRVGPVSDCSVIVGCPRFRALSDGVRVEALVDDRFHSAILAHPKDPRTVSTAGARKHPVLVILKLLNDPFDCASGAEGLAASDAVERLLFLEDSAGTVPCLKIEPRNEADRVLRTCRSAKTALHAETLREA